MPCLRLTIAMLPSRHMSDGELFRVVREGVRMTAMSAFGPTHQRKDIGNMVAVVRRLNALTPQQTQAIKQAMEQTSREHDRSESEHFPVLATWVGWKTLFPESHHGKIFAVCLVLPGTESIAESEAAQMHNRSSWKPRLMVSDEAVWDQNGGAASVSPYCAVVSQWLAFSPPKH